MYYVYIAAIYTHIGVNEFIKPQTLVGPTWTFWHTLGTTDLYMVDVMVDVKEDFE